MSKLTYGWWRRMSPRAISLKIAAGSRPSMCRSVRGAGRGLVRSLDHRPNLPLARARGGGARVRAARDRAQALARVRMGGARAVPGCAGMARAGGDEPGALPGAGPAGSGGRKRPRRPPLAHRRSTVGRLASNPLPRSTPTMNLSKLLASARDYGASDVHLLVDLPPMLRGRRSVVPASGAAADRGDDRRHAPRAPEPGAGGAARARLAALLLGRLRARRGRARVAVYRRNGQPELSIRLGDTAMRSRDELVLAARSSTSSPASAARARDPDRPHRRRQDHDVPLHARPHQRRARGEDHHDRGSRRVRPRAEAIAHRPAGGAHRRPATSRPPCDTCCGRTPT